MEAIFETKEVLRKKYLDKRMTLSQDEVFLFSEQIFEMFLKEFHLKPNSKIHCFLPITSKKEVDTQFFFNYCFLRLSKRASGEIITAIIPSRVKTICDF